MLVKIYRRYCTHRYREGKGVYKYYRWYMPIPAKFKDTVKPFLNKELEVEVKAVAGKQLLIIMAQEKIPVEIFWHAKKPPQKS